MKVKTKFYIVFVLYLISFGVCVYIGWGATIAWLAGMVLGIIFNIRRINKIKDQYFRQSIKLDINKMLDENRKLRDNDPVTDGEMQEYYQKYLKKVKRDDEWDTDDPMTYDEYKRKAYDYPHGPRMFCVVHKTDMFVGSPFGNEPMQFISFD